MEESGKGEWTRKQTRASVPYLLSDLQLDEAEPESLVGAVRQGPWAQPLDQSPQDWKSERIFFIFLPYVLEKRQQNMIFYLFLAGFLFYYFYLIILLFFCLFFWGGGLFFGPRL